MQVRAIVIALCTLASVARADRVIAVTPMSSLGAEDKSASTKKLLGQIEQAVAAIPGTKVVKSDQVAEAIKKANKPQLRACEADAACLAEVGKLVGAQIVITGEVGGLGTSQVVYLGATDVASAHELRSTTLSVGAKDDNPSGAVVRLLDPDQYKGTLRFAIDVTGATVFVNGSKVALSPKGEVALPVGRQAIRVTHPQYHDFVKFEDVEYDQTTDVKVGMQQYPIVEQDLNGKPTNLDKFEYTDPPMWRRWYVAGPAVVLLAVGAGVLAGVLAHDFPAADQCRKVGGMGC